ncbi:MAG: dioxygenase family protein [Actinomycetota bacterium]
MPTPISRRRALATIGTASVGTLGLGALLAACSGDDDAPETGTSAGSTTAAPAPAGAATNDLFADAASCTLTPEQTEGPFYVDVDSIRNDIREDREGAELRLAVRVLDEACAPIPNAIVDVWHCDSHGDYSAFEQGGGGAETTFLRGALVTNAEGVVEFLTVYPGAYRGRSVHIHAKVHLDNSTALTTQFYFDDEFTDAVYERAGYAAAGQSRTRNDDDAIFDPSLILTLSEDGDGHLGVITCNVAA